MTFFENTFAPKKKKKYNNIKLEIFIKLWA